MLKSPLNQVLGFHFFASFSQSCQESFLLKNRDAKVKDDYFKNRRAQECNKYCSSLFLALHSRLTYKDAFAGVAQGLFAGSMMIIAYQHYCNSLILIFSCH